MQHEDLISGTQHKHKTKHKQRKTNNDQNWRLGTLVCYPGAPVDVRRWRQENPQQTHGPPGLTYAAQNQQETPSQGGTQGPKSAVIL